MKHIRGGNRGKTIARWIIIVGLTLATVALLWVGLNVFVTQPLPPALWTEGDLPALPPSRMNGWLRFQTSVAGDPIEISLADDLLGLTDSERAAGPAHWRDVLALRASIHEAVESHDRRRKLGVLWESFAFPRFADACALELESECHWLEFFQYHRLAELDVLDRGLANQFPDAAAALGRLLHADVDLLLSTRSTVAHMIAVAAIRRTLEALRLVVDGANESLAGVKRTQFAARLTDVLTGLERLTHSKLDARRAVIAEYVLGTKILRDVRRRAARGVETGDSRETISLWFYDEGQTRSLLNARFVPLMNLARSNVTRPFKPEDPITGLRLWVYNPVGKTMLNALQTNLESTLQRFAKMGRDVQAVARDREVMLRSFVAGSGAAQPSPQLSPMNAK